MKVKKISPIIFRNTRHFKYINRKNTAEDSVIMKSNLKVTLQLHIVNITQTADQLIIKFIEMYEDNILINLFNSIKYPTNIWNRAVEYTRILGHTNKIVSCFTFTCIRESAFSYLTQVKNSLGTLFRGENLYDQLQIKRIHVRAWYQNTISKETMSGKSF